MDAAQLIALSPLLVLAGAVVAVTLAVAFGCGSRGAGALTVLGLGCALAALAPAAETAPRAATALFTVDPFALFAVGLFSAAGIVVAALAHSRPDRPGPAFDLLLLLAILAAGVLAAASHFASLFLGIELLSVALFALIAFPAGRPIPLEAGIKYLIPAGVSSALMLFGMALTYAATGSLAFAGLAHPGLAPASSGALLTAGLALILAGFGFKLSQVPFHLWTPDIYQGAPTPVAALVATVSKAAVAAALLRLSLAAGGEARAPLELMVALLAVASMIAGNLLALLQQSIRRLLAYSSIAHLGYLLVALLAGSGFAPEAVGYYLAAYVVSMLGAFAVVARLAAAAPDGDCDRLDDYRGLLWRRPWLGGALALMLFSLAGIPLTMGFVAKFYALAAGVEAGRWALVATLVVTSALGLFYYLRVIVILGASPPHGAESPAGGGFAAADWVLGVLVVLLIGLGSYPTPLLRVLGASLP